MSTEDEEYELEVGRPDMPAGLRPHVDLMVYAPPGFLGDQGEGVSTARKEQHMGTPLVSGRAAAVAGVLATVFGLAAANASNFTFLPSWAPLALWGAAAICAFLVGLPLPEYAGGAPVAQKAVPALGAISVGLGAAAASMPSGTPQAILAFLGLLFLAATGKAVPVKVQEEVRQ
jgi:hypothetical protein